MIKVNLDSDATTFYRIPTDFILHTNYFFHKGGVPASEKVLSNQVFISILARYFMHHYKNHVYLA